MDGRANPRAFVLLLLALFIRGTAMLPMRLRTTSGSSSLVCSSHRAVRPAAPSDYPYPHP